MLVALYLRRSTNETLQAESLETQEELLRAYAEREGHRVHDVYRDSASGRSTRHRHAFVQLIDRVKAGAPFTAILVRDVSRWGRFLNADESAYWEFVCILHGVRVLYVEEHFGEDSPTTTLMKALERWRAAEYSRERGRLTSHGRARTVRNGFAAGTPCPYAMRRTLVDRDGTFIQDLARGQTKVLSTQHVKLAPGMIEHVDVVRTIFRMYCDGWPRGQIAQALRDRGVLSPRRRGWSTSSVTGILSNECYIGASVLNSRDGIVRTPDAWPAIIDRETWAVVEKRLAHEIESSNRHRTALGLPTKRFRRRDPRPDYREFLPEAEALVDGLRVTLRGELSEEGLTPLGSSVRFTTAFPRVSKYATFWSFELDRTYDATIAVGLSAPPGARVVSMYFFDHAQIASQYVVPLVQTKSPRREAVDLATLRRRLHLHVTWAKARARMVDVAKEMPLVDMPALALALGWPVPRARFVYHGLVQQGVPLPPMRIKPGRRITVVCNRCGVARDMPPGQALQRATGDCLACSRSSNEFLVTCPFCRVERRVNGVRFANLSCGAETPCRRCHLTHRTAERHSSRRSLLFERAAILNVLASAVVERLRPNFEAYRHIAKRKTRGFDNPSIYWTNENGQRCRLVLRATDAAVRSGVSPVAYLDAAANPRCWTVRRSARKADVTYCFQVQ